MRKIFSAILAGLYGVSFAVGVWFLILGLIKFFFFLTRSPVAVTFIVSGVAVFLICAICHYVFEK